LISSDLKTRSYRQKNDYLNMTIAGVTTGGLSALPFCMYAWEEKWECHKKRNRSLTV
jgi:hypothetical protein